jgi:Tfp pilus assembly protein PilF
MNTVTTPPRTGTRSSRLLRLALLGAALLPLSASVSSAARAAAPVESPSPLTADYRLPDDPTELLRLDGEMRAFFGARVHTKALLETKLDEIVAAILGEKGLHFSYESAGIYAPREAFRRRSGNCVTFSMLVVAVAREYRIPASFNEVELLVRWDRVGGIVMERRHINVWVPTSNGGYEIDLKMFADLRSPRSGTHIVADARAFAALYGNAGVFRLAEGDNAGALHLLKRATEVDPSSPAAWVNLANAHLIGGANDAARTCFERALALRPSTLSAISGLAYVNRNAGRLDEAERSERKAARYRAHNPYYLCSLAREELADGHPEDARRHLARAIDIKDNEPEFYLLMVDVARSLGREREAKRWASRLHDLPRNTIAAAP